MAIQTYKLRLSWAALLIFVLFLSREVYIINEETLVLVAFTSFILLTYNTVSNLLSTELDERSKQIKKEFEVLFDNREKALVSLITFYKRQFHISEEISGLLHSIQTVIRRAILEREAKLTQNLIAVQKQKLISIQNKENRLLHEIQQETSGTFSRTVQQIATNGYYKRALTQDSVNTITGLPQTDNQSSKDLQNDIIRRKHLTHLPAEIVTLLRLQTIL